jgi:hypothetical protein
MKMMIFYFIYLSSSKLTHPGIFVENAFEFEIIERDSLTGDKVVKMITYSDKRKKKIVNTAQLKIKNYPTNLFALFRFSCMHPYEHFSKININENGIVESYKSSNYGKPIEMYLEHFSEISLSLMVNN